MTPPVTATVAPPKRPLRIAFLTTLATNVGDDFIREGLRAVLDTLAPGPSGYSPFYINKHDASTISRRVEDEPEALVDKYHGADLFIQSGAPVYWHLNNGKHRSVDAEWHSWLWQDRVLSARADHPLFLNLGAGSSQPWGDTGDCFVNDSACADFARAIGQRAALTTVRDQLASSILTRLRVAHSLVACPAFLAARRHPAPPPQPASPADRPLIGVNLMRLGGHFNIDPAFSARTWTSACRVILGGLRKRGTILFIAHDQADADFSARLAQPGERVFIASDFRDYLRAYASCSIVVANRVHGALGAAGYAVPAIILGNDTRALIGEALGIPTFRSAAVEPLKVLQLAERFLLKRNAEHQRLRRASELLLQNYQKLLRPHIQVAERLVASNPGADRPSKKVQQAAAGRPKA